MTKMFTINTDDLNVKFPSETIGVDMGQSLSKIVFFQDNKLVCSSFSTKNDLNSLKEILDSRKGQYKSINFTGGKCFKLFQSYSVNFQAP